LCSCSADAALLKDVTCNAGAQHLENCAKGHVGMAVGAITEPLCVLRKLRKLDGDRVQAVGLEAGGVRVLISD
jgi:hypothetical protein